MHLHVKMMKKRKIAKDGSTQISKQSWLSVFVQMMNCHMSIKSHYVKNGKKTIARLMVSYFLQVTKIVLNPRISNTKTIYLENWPNTIFLS